MITFEDWCELGPNPWKHDLWDHARPPITLGLEPHGSTIEVWLKAGNLLWSRVHLGSFEDPSRAELAAVTLRLSL